MAHLATETTPRSDTSSGLLGLLGEARATMVTSMADGARTVAQLSECLGISQVATRRHLTRLVEEGWVVGRTDEPDGPGRPVTRYQLTTDGHQLLPQGYALLAGELLTFIEDSAGQQGLADYIEWRTRRRVQGLSSAVNAETLDERLVQLAEALTDIGSTATVESTDDGYVLRQHHCTVMDVAREHPQLCHAEAQEFARVIGGDITISRGATRAGGDGICECAVVPGSQPATDLAPDDRPVLPMATVGNTSPP